jgi:hypothetical protein
VAATSNQYASGIAKINQTSNFYSSGVAFIFNGQDYFFYGTCSIASANLEPVITVSFGSGIGVINPHTRSMGGTTTRAQNASSRTHAGIIRTNTSTSVQNSRTSVN